MHNMAKLHNTAKLQTWQRMLIADIAQHVSPQHMQVGRRLTQVTILSGSVVRVWGALESILERNEHSLSKSDRTMRVVRVELEAGRHLVGLCPPCMYPYAF